MLLQKAELRSCVKVVGSSSLIVPTVCVDVKQHLKKKKKNYGERSDVLHTDGESFEDFWYEPTNEME